MDQSESSGATFLRCQFPRNPRRHYDRKGAEADARALAAIWMEVPPDERTVARLTQEAHASGLQVRIDEVQELEGMEAARFAPWLRLMRGPHRVFLVADVPAIRFG